MRYKTLEEVTGKYGLTVDLDEKAQLSEWESRLKNLLETKQKELPNAKNPSLRHKIERECAEVKDAFRFVSQQNFLTKLRRCVDEDKQEIFEHELRKPHSHSILPSESDPEYEQFLELKASARKKWESNRILAAEANSTAAPLASMGGLAPIAQPGLSNVEPGRGATGVIPPALAPTDPSRATTVNSAESKPHVLAAKNGPALDSDLSKKGEGTLQAAVQSASVTLATATRSPAENATAQTATTLSATTTPQSVNEQQTETTTSQPDASRLRPKIPLKREHVSTALDLLVKIRALTGLGGSFATLKIVGTALAVFLIALAGLITQFTRERSRHNEIADNTANAPTHEESRVVPAGSQPQSPDPSKQASESAKPSSKSPTAPSENTTQPTESAKQSAEIAKQFTEPAKQSSDVVMQSSDNVKQPSDTSEPARQLSERAEPSKEPAKPSSELAKPPSDPVKPVEIAKQSTESTEAPKPPSEVARQTAEPAKQAFDVPSKSTESPKPAGNIAKQPAEPAKQSAQAPWPFSAIASQISEIAKASAETSTPPVVVVAKQQESPQPEPPAETKSAPPPETKAVPAPKPKYQLALLRIETTPPDASISIRGTKQPLKTPAEFNLMPGDYDVALALDCYTSISTTLHLDAGENRVLTRQLQSQQPTLTVRTLPPGAKIYVDGAPRNQSTPATITGIEPGGRWVTVELPGYRSQNMAVKAKCGETVPADFGILQRLTARVSITSNARGSSVWMDGMDSGQTTPCSMELPLGTHRIRLVGPQGYRPEEKSFYLQNEESVRLDVPLTPELVAIPAYNPAPARPEPPQEFIPRANPNLLVWCGLDYSMVRMIGSPRDFPESEIFPNSNRHGERTEPMTTAWNELFMKEMYPRLGRDLRAIVQADLHAVEARNARVSAQQIVDEDGSPRYVRNLADVGTFFNPSRILHIARSDKVSPTHINDADIAAAIRSYRLQTRSGLGLVFIMDRLVKRQETSCMYVVFFDIASRTIISQERVCTEAGGGGIRNHWFGSIKETVKRLPDMYHDAKLKR
jgi:PEGA domain